MDEQQSGPFASWRHEHDLEAVDSRTTRLVDHVTYRLRGGWMMQVFNALIGRFYIKRILRQRQGAMKRMLES